MPGLAADISQQIAKYDSSEFDDDKEVAGGDAEGFNSKHYPLPPLPFPAAEFCFPKNLLIFPFISRATDRPETHFSIWRQVEIAPSHDLKFLTRRSHCMSQLVPPVTDTLYF